MSFMEQKELWIGLLGVKVALKDDGGYKGPKGEILRKKGVFPRLFE